MFQDPTDTGLDLHKVMKSVAQLNPHISLSDIAYLMDIPYKPDPGEFEAMDHAEKKDFLRMP